MSNRTMTKNAIDRANGRPAAPELPVAVFSKVAKKHLCFRECAKIVKAAQGAGCTIYLTAGQRRGSSESLLSLLRLGVKAGTVVTLTIRGEDTYTAFHGAAAVLDGTDVEEPGKAA